MMSPSLVVAAFAALAVVLPRAASAIAVSDVEGIENTVFKNITATGADSIFLDDGELVLIYSNATDSATLKLPGFAQAQILAVGGGGAGGSGAGSLAQAGAGGGGGAGGVVFSNSVTLAGGDYTVTVGAGGAAGTDAATSTAGGNGGDSKLTVGGNDIIVAIGGGGGGAMSVGSDGGSGGGGSRYADPTDDLFGYSRVGGSVPDSFLLVGAGFRGGTSKTRKLGAGGGGASAVGSDTASGTPGAGGAGIANEITGASVVYAGGGGGGYYNGTTVGAGGAGGGGNGGTSTVAAQDGVGGLGGGGGGNGGDGFGGDGGSGTVIVRISAVLDGPLEKPAESQQFVYNGLEQVVMPEMPFAYTIDGTAKATEVGDNYSFTVTLKEGFTWSDNSDEIITVNWKITQAINEITDLSIVNWKEGNNASIPTCKVNFGEVKYTYSTSEDGEYTATVPTVKGEYFLKATVTGTKNYTGAEAITSFKIYEAGKSNLDSLAYFADVTNLTYTAEAVITNFQLLVRISESAVPGFKYSQVRPDLSDLRFCDQEGKVFAHSVDEWNTAGESVVWVSIPEFSKETRLQMCWGKVAGEKIPSITEGQVWSDYVGVWHFAEASGTAFDSTGNNLHGTPKGTITNQMVGVEGLIGKSRVNYIDASYDDDVRSYIQVPNYNSHNVGGKFTISGWFKAKDIGGYHRLFSRRNAANANNGWEAEVNNGSRTSVKFRGAGSWNSDVTVSVPDLAGDWVYVSAVYSNTVLRVYTNGCLSASGTIAAATDNDLELSFGNNSVGKEESWFGWYDEIRLTKQVRSADWIKADYDQSVSARGYCAFDTAGKTKDVMLENFWTGDEPGLSSTLWNVGDSVTVNMGSAALGDVIVVYYNELTGETVTNTLPTATGVYTATFIVDGVDGYAPLEKEVSFNIVDSSPYNELTTADGRVMLAGNDNAEPKVTNQAYNDKLQTAKAFWEHSGSTTKSVNIWEGEYHTLWTKNHSSKLWYMDNVRLGNTMPTSAKEPNDIGEIEDLKAKSGQVFLPWSKTIQFNYSSGFAGLDPVPRSDSGNMLLRNTTAAAIYSSCFTNGIGTIYFDAANSHTGNAGDGRYKLSVYIATNMVDNATLIPNDENLGTNENGVCKYELADWKKVTIHGIKSDVALGNESEFAPIEPTETIDLAIKNGGSIKNFYRLYVPLQIKGPVRFKIVREDVDSDESLDGNAFIILDNIIASYPAMRVDMGSYGFYDEAKKGKFTLGQEMAWNTPFPDVDGEIYARGKPEYYTNAGDADADTSKFVISAKLNYRWRYLGQKLNPEEGWNSVYLNPNDNFKALEPLKLPGIHGDVEYWYELALNAPFYEYVDYSGSNLGLGGFYSEAVSAVTNRRDSALGTLPSQGTDWFVRLREGESDYQSAEVVIRRDDDGTEERIPMTVVADHVWRGLLPTATNKASTISYRLEFRNKQEPGSTEFAQNTNCWYSVYDFAQTPVSDILSEGTTNNWTKLNVDASTGYLMFQIDESTRALTIVHADYQNFNAWTDAQGDKFVGNKVEDNLKTGTSPRKQDFYESFDNWEVMPDSNANWKLFRFPDINDLYGRHPYVPFASDVDQNWQIGPGMWVSKAYRDTTEDKGVALQMEGCGKGFVQYTDAEDAPRGLESISFNARIGQYLQFDDFSYYAGDVIMKMTNYTFATRCAFDLNENRDFRGNASLSIVAYYIPGKGCYEARWEQIGAKWDKDGNLEGVAAKSQRLCLYRWSQSSGKMTAELLMAYTNANAIVTSGTDGIEGAGFLPFFISAYKESDSTTCVIAGVKGGYDDNGKIVNMNLSQGTDSFSSDDGKARGWYGVCYRDTSSKRHKAGTYGMVSANCPGIFGMPVICETPVSKEAVGKSASDRFEDCKITFETFEGCNDDLEEGLWIMPGRMQYNGVASGYELNYRHLVAAPVSQELNVYTASAGKTDWSLLFTTNLTGFGSVSASGTVHYPLYTTKDCSVRIAVGGQWDDPRNDVIIDTVELKQWRGDDYAINADGCVKGWENPYSGSMTNFVFTSCWIRKGATADDRTLLMSAKRVHTNNSDVCSIRSPVMDGYRFSSGAQRGKGLGMISVSYRNAQANTRLLVQVATNNFNRTYLAEYDAISPSRWVTVTNWNFAAELKNKRDSGILSCYVGIHDVSGLMRVIIDPELVDEVKGETDTAKFGEIEIVDIFCRDEPALDSLCWWGWNLRTIGAAAYSDSEGRMYLSDLTDSPADLGMSLALNNSVTEDIAYVTDHDKQDLKKNKPFLQTPYFGTNIVGEISFKARQYIADNAEPSGVVLYGSYKGLQTEEWTKLKEFVVTNPTYQVYTYKTEPGQEYAAFRLAVTGAEGVENTGSVVPDTNTEAQRVLIDEVLVSEAVRARMAFRAVGAFRSDMNGTRFVPNVPSRAEQPLCNESWGVQCEIYAAQLASDINFNIAPTVIFHWYEGEFPWGYENWKGRSKAQGRHSAVLARATGTNLIYRSSQITAPEAVVPMSTMPGSIVQYMLEVRYYTKESMKQMTNFLAATEWRRPDWYRPLDFNRDYGQNKNFAAYNILDTVAPGWAWINEVNIYGLYDENWYNSDSDCQFVEIAVPFGSDISGWKVRMLAPNANDGKVVTNTIAQFGSDELPGLKSGEFVYSNYVFHVLANRSSMLSGRLKKADGTLDGVWNFENPADAFISGGEIFATDPIAVQLIRPSGIVEHEILAMGTNFYGSLPGWEAQYDPERSVQFLRKVEPESSVFNVGSDDGGEANSLGVFAGRGETSNVWNRTMVKTPGRPNENQVIDPDFPTPNGETIIIYANVDNVFGRILQKIDGGWTNATQMLYIKRGSERGTNILYRVDPWFELGSVTTNGTALPVPAPYAPREYSVNVGRGMSNNFTVVAAAALQRDLVGEYGLTPDNRYTPAVVRWLEEGRDIDGNAWAYPDSGIIRLADFRSWKTDAVITNLNLTQMYWLDMDPTVGGLSLKGYVNGITPGTVQGDGTYSPDRASVKMMITNRTDDTASPYYGYAKPPYVLRGLEPGSNSWNYQGGWTSVTFKIAGVFRHDWLSSRRNWVNFRWFVFDKDSFTAADAVDPFKAVVDIKDPFSTDSPGYTAGWYDWALENGRPGSIFYLWRLDDNYVPISVEKLKQENFYE